MGADAVGGIAGGEITLRDDGGKGPIHAVKKPWWWSNCNEVLSQMLVTNQRLDQLAATCSDFAKWGMLDGSVFQDFFWDCEFLTSFSL